MCQSFVERKRFLDDLVSMAFLLIHGKRGSGIIVDPQKESCHVYSLNVLAGFFWFFWCLYTLTHVENVSVSDESSILTQDPFRRFR